MPALFTSTSTALKILKTSISGGFYAVHISSIAFTVCTYRRID
jgi:hypothetical protein